MKNQYKILGLVLICLSLSVVYSYADSVYGTMWKQEDTIVYPADDVEKIDFNNISGLNLLGVGGGCTGNCGFDNITATRIDATTGVFNNFTAINQMVILESGGTPGSNEAILSYASARATIKSNNGDIYFDPANGSVKLSGIRIGIPSAGYDLSLSSVGLINWSDNISTYTAGKDTGLNRLKAGFLKVNGGSSATSGSLVAPGFYTAFRIISSATYTLTSTDYFINCLANDNEVVLTMPPIDATYSQTLMVKYTDSGSANKCKLDGNGAEQVEGFAVYTSLDTYLEGAIFKSDGSAWWITGGI